MLRLQTQDTFEEENKSKPPAKLSTVHVPLKCKISLKISATTSSKVRN
jgi:hypothetical protein